LAADELDAGVPAIPRFVRGVSEQFGDVISADDVVSDGEREHWRGRLRPVCGELDGGEHLPVYVLRGRRVV